MPTASIPGLRSNSPSWRTVSADPRRRYPGRIDITERRIARRPAHAGHARWKTPRPSCGWWRRARFRNNLLTVISGYGQLALEGLGTVLERAPHWLPAGDHREPPPSALPACIRATSNVGLQPPPVRSAPCIRSVQPFAWRGTPAAAHDRRARNPDLTVRCGPEPCLIRADTHQIEQVLMNLAVNARDAMPLGANAQRSSAAFFS